MSYDITNWKTTKLENLVLSMNALYNQNIERKDWLPDEPKIIDSELNKIEIYGGCGQSIIGILNPYSDDLHVEKINLSGEGASNWRYYHLDDVFKKSKGILEATLIYEGGDSITKFKLNNGELIEEKIDI